MKKVMPYLVLIAMIASVLVPVGIGYAKAEPVLAIAAGAYNIPEFSFTINPCKYTYDCWGMATAQTTITELSGKGGEFDLGNGSIVTIPAYGNLTCSYKFNYLHGQTERIRITRLVENQGGLSIQEVLVLKIEPIKKGGDTR